MSEEILPAPVAPPDAGTTFLDIISRAAADPQTDVGKLERLTALYERHLEREAQRAYTAAMALMQPHMPEIEEHGAIRNRQGEVQSTYALWEDVQKQIKPILAEYGFSLSFGVEDRPNEVRVTGKLSHKDGHVERETKALPLDTTGAKNNVQAHGSTVSYGQRYVAKLLLNLTSRGEDDDGQAGGTPLIGPPQVEVLRKLLEQARGGEKAFCDHFKIASIDLMPLDVFPIAERMLQDRIIKLGPAKQQQSQVPVTTAGPGPGNFPKGIGEP